MRYWCGNQYEQIPLELVRKDSLLVCIVGVCIIYIDVVFPTVDALMIIEEKASLRLVYKVHQVLIDPEDLVIPFQTEENYRKDRGYEAKVLDRLTIFRIITTAVLC